MLRRIQFYLIVAGVVVVFDAIGSALSKTLVFDYTKLMWISYLLYIAAGYFGCKTFDLLSGIVAGFIAGFVDSTIGWFLSSLIGPFIPFAQPKYNPLMISLVIFMVSLWGALLGFGGGLLYNLVNRGSGFADR